MRKWPKSLNANRGILSSMSTLATFREDSLRVLVLERGTTTIVDPPSQEATTILRILNIHITMGLSTAA